VTSQFAQLASSEISTLNNLIGNSPVMRQVHRLIARMAKSRFPVLILGETGTGKEIVARSIHQLDGRGPFIVVDCSSLVGPLIESELFGYAKGAFTGADNQKLGLLDAANGGTAFFDEIGELPIEMQQKLLRVLQEKEFRAIGGLATRSSNFRIIAATNRDLAKEVDEKRFRQDLYYRLSVMRLRLPPLRERREDVPVLIAHFLDRYGNNHKLPDEVLAQLMDYDWPGNVRELEHTVQQMVAMNSGPWLSNADLPSSVLNRNLEREIPIGNATAPPPTGFQAVISLDAVVPLTEIEKRAILQAIEITKGDRSLAADLLGIGRTTLYRKLKSYGF
jgi:transcriptional regulator with PAS, ATPase and Fis domain